MVLTSAEFETAQDETCAGKLLSLFQLRQRTTSFLIQCLADREIQTLLDTAQTKAYRYNCAVIHNPHAWSHLPPIKDHGWNSSKDQPIDPNLKIGRVLGQQYNSAKQNNIPDIGKSHKDIQELEELIKILKEENFVIKKKYQECLEASRTNSNSTVTGSNRTSLQLRIENLQSELLTKTYIIEFMEKERTELGNNISTLKTILTTTQIKLNQALQDRGSSIRPLQQQIQNMRFELETKTNTILRMENENRELRRNISANDAQNSLERQQGCCVVM